MYALAPRVEEVDEKKNFTFFTTRPVAEILSEVFELRWTCHSPSLAANPPSSGLVDGFDPVLPRRRTGRGKINHNPLLRRRFPEAEGQNFSSDVVAPNPESSSSVRRARRRRSTRLVPHSSHTRSTRNTPKFLPSFTSAVVHLATSDRTRHQTLLHEHRD